MKPATVKIWTPLLQCVLLLQGTVLIFGCHFLCRFSNVTSCRTSSYYRELCRFSVVTSRADSLMSLLVERPLTTGNCADFRLSLLELIL